MGRKLTLITSYFVGTFFVLIGCIISLLAISFEKNPFPPISLLRSIDHVAYAAIPTQQNTLLIAIEEKDARIEAVRQFLTRYGSPLEPYAKHIVDAADLYGLDFRLIPAIAMQESNLCKKSPKNSNNCWGFGIYGKKVTKFDSYPQAIETVTKTLAHEYKGKGLETPQEIASKYTPSDNGKWVDSVSFFMNLLRITP